MNLKNLKVYTVRVTGCIGKKSRWYTDRVGEVFECVLVCKEGDSGIMPHFALIEHSEGGLIPPALVRTIRPEDCTVLSERVHLVNTTLASYVERFAA